jgi:hypothetical protein
MQAKFTLYDAFHALGHTDKIKFTKKECMKMKKLKQLFSEHIFM